MLNEAGRLMGDLTVARLDDDRFWLTGSYYLQDWHVRWFRAAPARRPGVDAAEHHRRWMGFSDLRARRRARILDGSPHEDVSNDGFGFLTCRRMDVGTAQRGRRADLAHRRARLRDRGPDRAAPHALSRAARGGQRQRPAARSATGPSTASGWRRATASGPREFTQDVHAGRCPASTGSSRSTRATSSARDAARRERDDGARAACSCCWRSTPTDADASGDEGIWIGDRRVGIVTSGAYGHHVGKSLALAYVDREIAETEPELTVHVVGEERTARILPEPPYDPKGSRLRDTE